MSVHRESLVCVLVVHSCVECMSVGALGALDGRFLSELVSKTFLGQGRLFCENQPAGHRTVLSLAQLLLVTRGQRTPGLHV